MYKARKSLKLIVLIAIITSGCVVSSSKKYFYDDGVSLKKDINDSSNIAPKKVAGAFKVVKIKRIPHAYIIDSYDINKNINFTIISIKKKCKSRNKEKIKVNKTYSLVLNSYFDRDYFPGDNYSFIKIEGIKLSVKPKGFNIYTTDDIIGLYLIDKNF